MKRNNYSFWVSYRPHLSLQLFLFYRATANGYLNIAVFPYKGGFKKYVSDFCPHCRQKPAVWNSTFFLGTFCEILAVARLISIPPRWNFIAILLFEICCLHNSPTARVPPTPSDITKYGPVHTWRGDQELMQSPSDHLGLEAIFSWRKLQFLLAQAQTELISPPLPIKGLYLNIIRGYLRRICSFMLRRIVTFLLKCAGYKYSYSLTHSHLRCSLLFIVNNFAPVHRSLYEKLQNPSKLRKTP